MSKAARELAQTLEMYRSDSVPEDAIDEAVKPLACALESTIARLRLDGGTDQKWLDQRRKALEPWRQK